MAKLFDIGTAALVGMSLVVALFIGSVLLNVIFGWAVEPPYIGSLFGAAFGYYAGLADGRG